MIKASRMRGSGCFAYIKKNKNACMVLVIKPEPGRCRCKYEDNM
jgi:hypothetical protein